ncbi:MAG TPA: Gfo/Idh/MocA family oxidoreductase [Flavitalea sp.]|nr:Gfo/Idh/MocA family oxidoreductase [Flavitalea sp.]
MKNSRRDFVKKAALGAAGVSFAGGILPAFSAKSYANIIGANERILVAMMGVNSRGSQLGLTLAKQSAYEVLYVCDVDSRASEKFTADLSKLQNKRPKAQPDFRKALEDKQLDALIVAAPDHWHAPAAILACKAGKHVYLEKPCSHNPHEGELIVAAAKKYNRTVLLGTQRRSLPNIQAAIKELHAGIIGRPYYAKTAYSNNRPSIGIGRETAVPSWLDFELWQGPAPRGKYKDNIVHYNWHWFWNWGTGEACNNGVHSVDIARWGLGVDYPVRVSSGGGRFHYKDDWETPDTQSINMEFDNNTLINWEGISCNGQKRNLANGVMFYGDNGSLLIGGGENAYTVYDKDNKVVKQVGGDQENGQPAVVSSQNSSVPISLDSTTLHFEHFADVIRKGAVSNQDILSGHKSTLLLQLGNIAQRTGHSLQIDPKNGHILNDPEAMKYWSREYQPGWEPKL